MISAINCYMISVQLCDLNVIIKVDRQALKPINMYNIFRYLVFYYILLIR